MNESLILALSGHTAAISKVAFNPAKPIALTAGYDGSMRIWNLVSGSTERTLHIVGSFGGATFSPDGGYILSGGSDAIMRLWNAETGDHMRTFAHLPHSTVTDVAFGPNGIQAVSVSNDRYNCVRAWNLPAGKLLFRLQGHTQTVTRAAFSPEGERIVSGGCDRKVKLWSARNGRLIRTLQGAREKILAVAFLPDGRHVIAGGERKEIRLWNAETGELQNEFQMLEKTPAGSVRDLAVFPDGSVVLAAIDNCIHILDLQTRKESIPKILAHTGPINSISLHPKSQFVLTGSSDKMVKLWDRSKWKAPDEEDDDKTPEK